jgi:1-acyl-sn-glycerol-3-phosphate acyltransferase
MDASSADVVMSWLPLYHDLGLIGTWLGSLYYAAPAIIMSPLDFLIRPARWLWAIHRNHATISAAPNFAFELCLSKVSDEAIEGLDLSSLRMVANGAEPVSPSTIRGFTARYARYGFRPEAMAPAYGLAENAVGLAISPPGRGPIIDRIARDALAERGEAVPARPDDPLAIEFVACGQPLPRHEVRLIDATGHEVGERREGRLQFRGPSATSGYFRNEAKTRELFDGTWLDSGDHAYIAGGEIFITGRVKDIIIRAGRNIYPHEVEEAVGNIARIRKGCVAVFASTDPSSGTERIVVLAETHETEEPALAELRHEVGEVATDLLGMPPDEIVLAPPYAVPKTSSGKLRRAAASQRYEAGLIGARPRALWLQVARLTLAGLRPQARRLARAAGELLYTGYWWAIVALLAGVTWPLVLLLPKRAWRWALIHGIARLGLRLMGIPMTVEGGDQLPQEGGVLVANHASYFDVFALSAALGGELVFAAKGELAPQFFAGRFLRRIGTLFVERRTAERGVEDTREAVARASRRVRMVFFPEGTLTRMPGLLAFHLGAFITAVEAGVPVLPVAIRGTRSILRGGQWFSRRGSVSLKIFAPIFPKDQGFEEALKMRDAARAVILANCGEPDLSHEPIHPPQGTGLRDGEA